VENIVDPDRLQKKIWRMRTACCILKATDTHSKYVVLIAFRQQQWLHERAWMLRYTYIACLLFHFDIYFHELSVYYNKNYLMYLHIAWVNIGESHLPNVFSCNGMQRWY